MRSIREAILNLRAGLNVTQRGEVIVTLPPRRLIVYLIKMERKAWRYEISFNLTAVMACLSSLITK